MATTATTLHLPDGNDVYYIDSGPVAGCKYYTTLILVHGSVVNARSFDKVHEIAGKNRLRTVALNRRDYPGTTRYTDDELADLKSGQEAVLQRTSVQLAHFITEFINLNDIPLPGGHGTGGLVVVGWSMGVATVLSLFAYPTALPPRCHDVLTRYVRSLVLYDPPYLAFGMELPSDTSIYNIWSELDSKPHEEVYRSFGEWVSSYFDVPENWSGSINDLDGRKSTGRMTVLSQEDQNRSVSLDVAMRSETFWFTGPMQPTVRKMATRCLFNEGLANVHFPNLEIVYVTCRRSCWHAIWAAHEIEGTLRKHTARGARTRPMKFVSIAEANHRVHWEDPQTFLDALSLQ